MPKWKFVASKPPFLFVRYNTNTHWLVAADNVNDHQGIIYSIGGISYENIPILYNNHSYTLNDGRLVNCGRSDPKISRAFAVVVRGNVNINDFEWIQRHV